MKQDRIREKLIVLLLIVCVMVAMVPAMTNAAVPENVESLIKYQIRDNKDIRLISYVDELEAYTSVAFTLTIDGVTSKEMVCTHAYEGLYANGEAVTTQMLYGEEGYFVTYTITNYLNYYDGKEVTITVKYNMDDGTVSTTSRTVTIGKAMEAVTVKGNLTYVNGYDWTAQGIYAFAQTDATQTIPTVTNQAANVFGYWYGIALEYNETTGLWKVVETDFTPGDGTCSVMNTALADDVLVIMFHDSAATANADAFNFYTTYALEGAELALNVDITTLQMRAGALSDVYLSYTYYVPVDGTVDPEEGEGTDPDEGETTDPDAGDTPSTPTGNGEKGQITTVNYYQWNDSSPMTNYIYGYASNSTTQTALNINGNNALFSLSNGIVLQYNSATGKHKVIDVDFNTTDGVNSAENVILKDGILVVLFDEAASIGMPESYKFFKENAVVGAEFYLSVDLSYIQYSNGATGSVSNLYLSLEPLETEGDDTTEETEDPVVGTVASTVATYLSTGSCTRSYGDTDGLSAVLYAPSSATGVSTWLNLGAVDTTLYANDEALAKQLLGAGVSSNKDVDNAYLYLCMNSSYWSGDFGLIKRLNDKDWEIVTSEYFNNTWRWNAYAYPDSSGVTVSYDEDYVYWKYNVMDGIQSLYIKDSANVGDLQMNLIKSGSTMTFSIVIGDKEVFSMSDSITISSLVLGRAASLTNSNTTSYGSSNYLYQIASTLQGKTPATMTDIQFYDTYYYTSSGNNRLTVSNGALWIYPNNSSNAGYKLNTKGVPIVRFQEVLLTDGRYMDIINFNNY
ncbi:MAG: hypothetical protein IKJ16_03035 [Agathobacter sp.]|nr:hypothetical protein [Agathobacter sp.]